MPLVRFVGIWNKSSVLPSTDKRKLPFVARFSGNDSQVMTVLCDVRGQWYGLTRIPNSRAVELFKITSAFEWYSDQVSIDRGSLGLYAEDAISREVRPRPPKKGKPDAYG